MKLGPAPREKPIHFAAKVNENGDVSALCYERPHKISLAKASWTLRPDAITCARCKAIYNAGGGAPVKQLGQGQR